MNGTPHADPYPTLRERVLGLTPHARPDARLAVAVGRAGALPVLDLDGPHDGAAVALGTFLGRWTGPAAVRLGAGTAMVDDDLPARVRVVIDGPSALTDWHHRRPIVQVVDLDEALEALAGGAGGLIAKGAESGGRVGEETAFVLVQQFADVARDAAVPLWAQGGIGPHTAAAAVAGGATGVVLDAQLALARESATPRSLRRALRAMDGSETVLVGGHRVFTRPDLPVASTSTDTDPDVVAARLGPDLVADLVPVGQDGAFAGPLAARHVTAGGIVAAVGAAIDDHLASARRQAALAPGRGVAGPLGTAVPVAQGPMTRVSDRAEFAAAVAEGGGLPFLALSLMSAPEVEALLDDTARLLGERPWGVGLLGFVPAEVRDAQLEVVRRYAPSVALIAGGRPSQAAPLEAEGIATFLHVPSPALLERFLRDGARRFVFEGRECGGHVGPRSSFSLWQAQIDQLLGWTDLDDVDVLFAGGIHDARSAAMVASAAAPIVDRGARIGVLMGTAYLATEEAVASGAIEPAFQEAAMRCERTVLLETAPGHATRCVESDYVEAFREERARLEAEGHDPKAIWAELEQLNLGRLRIASKGLRREGDEIVAVDAAVQRREGMFMIGQAASMRTERTTVRALHEEVTTDAVTWLDEHHPVAAVPARPAARPLDVAVVGMAAVFPGARDVDEYWANVLAGVDAVTEVPADRWDARMHYDAEATSVGAGRRTPSKWGGFLPNVPFDPLEYGIPPRSLASIGPDQILSLEVAARALADAGYGDRPFDRERAAVVFGAEAGTDLATAYGFRASLQDHFGELPPELDEFLPELTEDSFPGVLANVIAGRIANRLDLGGANFTIDAACGSSLAALGAACKELTSDAADLVLCGGVDVHNGLNDYLLFSSVHALSPTGRCRTFDREADGIALGEGVACVALKRLEDAERDGDRIYAVVAGVGASSDGRSLGLTAPRADGQRRALDRAYAQAGVEPSSVGLVEAHGTGTVVGDRTELETLTQAFGRDSIAAGSVVLGSVKSQIGHTKCAAGLAGLVKVARSLHVGVRPPTINLTAPNPGWDAATSPFSFASEPRPWAEGSRRGGVSAFGFGGANFHTVLEAYEGDDGPAHGVTHWPAELFLIRGDDRDAAVAQLDVLEKALDANDAAGRPWRLRQLAAALADRGRGPVQVAIVADDLDDLRSTLSRARTFTTEPGRVHVADGRPDPADTPSRTAFLFPGQGSQRVGMARELFVTFPGLQRHLAGAEDIADLMFPPAAFDREGRAAQKEALTDTRAAQPALAMVDLAMVDLLARVGVTPDAVAGHSYGEVAALAAAGSLPRSELVGLSRARAESILAAAGEDPGSMAAVKGGAAEVAALLDPALGVVVANDNAPDQAVVSGPTVGVEKTVARLQEAGLAARAIPVACAFHSPVVAGARQAFAEALEAVEITEPAVPVYANCSAEPYPHDAGGMTALLADQLVSPVRFREQVEAMYADGVRVFVEAGPGRVLTQLVSRILGDRSHVAVATDVAGEHGVRRFLVALAELAAAGIAIETDSLFEGRVDEIELGSTPPARPCLVNGHLVMGADGEPLANSLQPADRQPTVGLGGADAAGDRETTVADYLANLRQLVAAERDVMLAYLGADPAAVPAPPRRSISPASGEPVSATREIAGPSVEAPSPVLSAAELMAAVTAVVSERTGYPVEMLEPDLDLEAELSIDSIKRIEILGELADRVGLPGVDGGEVDESVVEELSSLKTLREVVDWIVDHADSAPPAAPDHAGSDHRSSPVLSAAELMAAVTAVVSERTGYPVEMLEPDLDLEAELSIDSIKRIEILGELADRVGLPGVDGGEVDESVVEELSSLKTLREVVDWIVDHSRGEEPTSGGDTAAASGPADEKAVRVPASTLRFVPRLVEIGPPMLDLSSLAGLDVVVVADDLGVAACLSDRLEQLGARVSIVDPRERPGDPDVLVVVAPLSTESCPADLLYTWCRDAAEGRTRQVCFAGAGGGSFGQLDGGETTRSDPDRVTGAVRGMVKTLAREYPDLDVRLVDLAVDESPARLASQLADEVCATDGLVEVGWCGGRRHVPALAAAEPADERVEAVDEVRLDERSVVLLTGGARGITAMVAVELARRYGCSLELVGRTPFDEGARESATVAAAETATDVRRALIQERPGERPAEIEAACRSVLAIREISATLDRIRSAGGRVRYHAVDVRDEVALAALVTSVYDHHGRLDGVIHGAGAVEDKYLRDKQEDSFNRVFDTKIAAVRAIEDVLRLDVSFVVYFGSIAGVFGNRGQFDYAAANAALDYSAHCLSRRLPGRVLAVDWGPWAATGMVSPELEREYARRGVGLVDPSDGVGRLLDELESGCVDAQVVLMRSLPEHFGARTVDIELPIIDAAPDPAEAPRDVAVVAASETARS